MVLPALPVIATTRVPLALRTACARSCSALVVSSTSITPPRRVRCAGARPDAPVSTIAPIAPLLERLADELVRVEPLAAQRDEEVARLQRPGIGHDVPDLAARIARPDQAADRLGHPPQRQAKLVTQPAT